MTKNSIIALDIICKNTSRTRNINNLYYVFTQKNKKISKNDWQNILSELSDASLISINNEQGAVYPKPLAYTELEKNEEIQNNTFWSKLQKIVFRKVV